MRNVIKILTKKHNFTSNFNFPKRNYQTLEWELFRKYNSKHWNVVEVFMYEKKIGDEVSSQYLGSIFTTLKLIPEFREHEHSKIVFLNFNYNQRCVITDEYKEVTTSLGQIIINEKTNVNDFIKRYKEPLWDMKNYIYYVPYVNYAFIKVL